MKIFLDEVVFIVFQVLVIFLILILIEAFFFHSYSHTFSNFHLNTLSAFKVINTILWERLLNIQKFLFLLFFRIDNISRTVSVSIVKS